MKRTMLFLLATVLCLSPLGCTSSSSPSTNPQAPPIPGALNTFDSDTYRALATMHGFATQAASNPAILTAIQKTVLNEFITDLNAADQLYTLYHSGAATQAAMQTSLAKAQADQTAYTTASGVK